jgi:hypothetical protein
MRLTLEEMIKKYPNRWLGLKDIEYADSEERKIISAEIVYTDKSASELGWLSLQGQGVQPFFTTPDNTFQLGIIGGIQ